MCHRFERLDARDCPDELKAVCRTALQKEPADRYQTASEFIQALEGPLANVEPKKRSCLFPLYWLVRLSCSSL